MNITTKIEEIASISEFMLRYREAEQQHFNPFFICHDSVLSDVSLCGGRTVINFGSYNYLGMSGRKEVSDAAIQAIQDFGTSASGSRIIAGEKTLFQELEREIADWKHTEAALVLPSGNLTNTTFVGNFCGEGDLIFYDALCHASITQGCKMSSAVCKRFPHNNFNALRNLMNTMRKDHDKVLIVVEGVYSMDGDVAPVNEFVRLKKEFGAFLMVDEAHSTGVIGATGRGIDEYFQLQPGDVDIKMGTLSKAIGSIGGFLAGSRELITYLKYNLPGFIFSAGISPASAAAALASIRLMRADCACVTRLQENVALFYAEANKRGFNTCLAKESPIIPILIGKDEDAFILSNLMLNRGIFVPPAAYPAVPRNKARLRFNVISEHKPAQIIAALDTLLACQEELETAKAARG